MQKFRWSLLILAVVAALVLAIQNHDSTEIQLFFFKRSFPLSVLLVATTAIGFVMGVLTTALRRRRHKAEPRPRSAETMATDSAESTPNA